MLHRRGALLHRDDGHGLSAGSRPRVGFPRACHRSRYGGAEQGHGRPLSAFGTGRGSCPDARVQLRKCMPDGVRVAPDIQALITFKQLNLLGSWPMKRAVRRNLLPERDDLLRRRDEGQRSSDAFTRCSRTAAGFMWATPNRFSINSTASNWAAIRSIRRSAHDSAPQKAGHCRTNSGRPPCRGGFTTRKAASF